MEETQLLIFRCGAEKYGVPVKDVSGIISNAGTNGLSIFQNVEESIHSQGEPVPISDVDVGFTAGENKSAIITHASGVQILIIVDEVIQERKISSPDSKLDATIASLQIWKFKKG